VIPYGKQSISKADINAVVKVLNSDFLTQGPVVPKFEQELEDYTGANHAIAVNSCTSALHIACMSLGLGPGDILWTSPISFVASANCALYCGAKVEFVDIDIDTALMSVSALKSMLQRAKKNGKLPKIVVPVHFAGQSCDMQEISLLSKEYGFSIIEDAAHAIGGDYQNEKIGCCKYSDITVFSFHPVKIITSGEGGALLTNNNFLSKKIQLYRSHGITRDSGQMKSQNIEPWYYEQIALGYNYRMTDLQAALGVSQLNSIDQFISKRAEIANFYDNSFSGSNAIPLKVKNDRSSSNHLYVLRVNDDLRRNLYDKLIQAGIGANVHYIPIYKQPYFDTMGFKVADFPNSEKYYRTCITIPIHPNLENTELNLIVDTINYELS
jgi:UDP-4-amino-4,6-dideoxy-N-acetyl-beta-L-altrosamine transaminase